MRPVVIAAAPHLQVRLHHVAWLCLSMQHQVYRVALRHKQLPAVPERVEHHHQHRRLACNGMEQQQACKHTACEQDGL
jgi:desulfoferrodoxin (superoxide reductase-like protein)